MEKTIIQMIKEAATMAKNSKLKCMKNVQSTALFQKLAEVLGLDDKGQAMLFVIIFDISCSSATTDVNHIAHYLDCSTLDAIEYVPSLNRMFERGILEQRWDNENDMMHRQYFIHDDVMAAIIEGNKLPKNIKRKSKEELDKYDLCKMTDRYVQDNDADAKTLFKEVDKLEKECSDKNFIKEVKGMVKDLKERALFYEMCYDLINENGSGKSGIKCTLSDMYDRIHDRIAEQKLIDGDDHPLIKAGLIERMNEEDMCLTDKGIDIFLGNDRSIFCKSYTNLDRYEFANAIDEFIDKEYKVDESLAIHRLRDKIRILEDANPQLHFIEPLKRLVGDELQRTVFYISCHKCAEEFHSNLTEIIKSIYPMNERGQAIVQLKEENHHLQKVGLVELEKTSSIFGDSTSINPTEKGKILFFEEDAPLYIEKTDSKDLIACDKIETKHLFFESALSEQLSLVSDSLQEDHYLQLCERLQNKSLPHGIAILLYGLPGTGKTESVMQIARQTGRNIVHVDISQTKSCWFGSSEKLIKKVFDNYKSTCKKSKKKPILLFNEADAVFSKRKSIGSSHVDQTENAMQNIILEEMERLDGILIATTNLTDNLDAAFERRFLFKIRFDRPTMESKVHIWKDKIPTLSESDATTLASSFDFSGGEIDNIARKALMQEVIEGKSTDMDTLRQLCCEEKIEHLCGKIGF